MPNFEIYTPPSQEEIDKDMKKIDDEESMTYKEGKMSEEREATFNAGRQAGKDENELDEVRQKFEKKKLEDADKLMGKLVKKFPGKDKELIEYISNHFPKEALDNGYFFEMLLDRSKYGYPRFFSKASDRVRGNKRLVLRVLENIKPKLLHDPESTGDWMFWLKKSLSPEIRQDADVLAKIKELYSIEE